MPKKSIYEWQGLLLIMMGAVLLSLTSWSVAGNLHPEMEALERAITDLAQTWGTAYGGGADYLGRLKAIEQKQSEAGYDAAGALSVLKREALLANPLLDFSEILVVQRRQDSPNLGLPQNWQGNCSLPRDGFNDRMVAVTIKQADASLREVYQPAASCMVADMELHYDGSKLLFSMPDERKRWQIWELNLENKAVRQVTPGQQKDYDNYDACYLPDDRIIYASTAVFQGVPCVGGGDRVANLYLMNSDGSGQRRLCFDQDHNWCPAVMADGRVAYTRWEYSDTPHYFSRLLFAMNPDGTNQKAIYGSNSYWPNSIFYARSIPGNPGQLVAVVSGHHGVARMGELYLFDLNKGSFEADGVVQQIPGYGQKVEAKIVDTLVNDSWPKFLHPWPLSDRYFLAAAKPAPDSLWGIYLVDIFDNRLLIKELPGFALLEPVPLQRQPRPVVIPDRVNPQKKDAQVYLADVYSGPGLRGVPHGTVKNLRLYSFHYAYPAMGGHRHVAMEGGWDVHRILGTVPVEEDGSASFTVPANTPVAVQPLDDKGRAVQVMRSWFTAMPGELLSCVGCHEQANSTPPMRQTLAARRAPSEIKPWYGPARGFSFKREVQPVLDRQCVGCHDGSDKELPDFRRQKRNGWGNFTPAYLQLHPWVRRPGPESDYHLPEPLEFHASTSELVQMLEKGHKGVQLDGEAWDRLYTWIDLNVPDHGAWTEHRAIAANYQQRRNESDAACAGLTPETCPELQPQGYPPAVEYVEAKEPELAEDNLTLAAWPLNEEQAVAAQKQAAGAIRKQVDSGGGVVMEMVLIPSGSMIMGSREGYGDEQPRRIVQVDKPFWMAVYETTNAQYHGYDPGHDNGYVKQQNKDHTTPGYPMDDPLHPVVRITQQEAQGFCQWLSEKMGGQFSLPTEEQWEWACRAGADTPFSYGNNDANHDVYANLADQSIKLLAVEGINPQPMANPSPYEDWLPKDSRFNDGQWIVCQVGRYQPNRWGLYDMHGNVWEWTAGWYRPDDGRVVARGGSWQDRPVRARSSARLAYEPWQKVFNVGFRVICDYNQAVDNQTVTQK